ncbi:MAG: DUF481 domain-containing protein [Reichenbachiella sp.]|uniref:DUF481 domain-containing protein n=1 Tax=Reichenbachiella sp. TaxID=2184521 RepID=UPI002965D108|nr:DUF481 domain-containing protein [Reichenbachiella sp.]MDW3210840.1 DUF481 domain-containing protein [Reichenbachiella sp.]
MKRSTLFVLFILSSFVSFSQNQDTVYMHNNQILIGEIKELENGVLKIETEYSEDDFSVDWDDAKSLKTNTSFIIMLSHNYRFTGTISPDPNNSDYLILYPQEGSKMFAKTVEIVYLKSLEDAFLDRISANIDAGLSITKASDTKQLNVSGGISYLDTNLQSDLYVNALSNVVQDTIVTERDNYGASLKVFFARKWYVLGAADFLKSDEQNLDIRTTVQTGIGRDIIRNNKMYLVTATGLALNAEKYSHEDDASGESMETFAEIEYKAFGIKDFTLSTKVQYFTILANRNRQRVNVTFDIKYDLPLDFYIGANVTYNYDSNDETTGSPSDYVIKSSVGWKF